MVQNLERKRQSQSFPESAPAANPVFFRTYSRRTAAGLRESWDEVCDRTLRGLVELGKLNSEEAKILDKMQRNMKSLPSGRWMWVGGTDWLGKPKNFSGAYNCTSTNLVDWQAFGLMMDLAMMGCGTGAIIEPQYVNQLPPIRNRLNVTITGEIGCTPIEQRREFTETDIVGNTVTIHVGDSREGWVKSYQTLLELSTDERFSSTSLTDHTNEVQVIVDISDVRKSGEALKGFGGMANPVKLPGLYQRCASILNQALGRQLTSVECCLLIDEAAVTIVAGNIRRSAGMRQFVSEDEQGANAKNNLWQQDSEGNWRIDPERDALRMANHTRVFHRKPTLEESIAAVQKQYYSGEGAIQWAGEAVARANIDLLNTLELKTDFLQAYEQGKAKAWIQERHPNIDEQELEHRLGRYGLNPCGEIIGANFHCNLSEVHLNQLDPDNYKEQEEAFKAGALSVAALLNHQFLEPRYQYSRELDPIVGVSFTGLFDFFVHAFGVDWLRWWEQGRPETHEGLIFKRGEQEYLSKWREIVHQAVWEYCDKHEIKRPNRCTTVQPSGCLDRTALRIFDQGLLYADELIAPGSGETINLKLSVRQGISVSTGIANQPLQLIKVTLSNGRILRMTPNHRLSINGNWVYAADMISGMKIDFSLGEYQNQQEVSLLNIDQFEYTREGRQLELGHSRGVTATIIKTPKIMSPDLSYFIGALFGDGCLSPHKQRIRFCSNDYALLERLQKIGQQIFALEGQIRKYSDREAFELSFASIQLFNWLQLNGLAKTEESQNLDRIPLAIRCSSKQSILSFFCGLIDTDGCIRSTGRMSIDSASEKFLRNLQQIGEAVGLCFSIFHTQGENKQAQKDMWGLCLSQMLSQPDALAYLNSNSQKAQARPIPSPKRSFKFQPYTVASVQWEETPDYSYDFAVEGTDDNDSWYWQGGIKSHNTKSLLTGASSGWHPPKAQRFIRRITFRKNDPVALACIDYGYNVIPSQSDKDENGNLLNDPFDNRCTEWLVEIPVAVSWADLPGADIIDVSKFSVLAQLDFVMQVQKYYTAHNTSATLELRSEEVEPLGTRIYEAIQNDEGYISAALLARFDDIQTFPRLPFEPIDKATYQRLSQEVKARRKTDDFCGALSRYDLGELAEAGPSGCDSDKCMFPEQAPTS